MGSTRRPFNLGSRITKDNEFIRCVDDQENQIHELWCLGLDNITQEVHPTARVEVVAGTVGELTIDYLAENGRIIPIIRQISINNSVQFLGIPDFFRGSGLSFFPKLQAPNDPTGWGNGGTSNKNWGVIPGGPHINTSVAWGTTISDRPAYMPRSPFNPRAAARRICDELICCRHRGCMIRSSTSLNTIVNDWVHRWENTGRVWFINKFCNKIY